MSPNTSSNINYSSNLELPECEYTVKSQVKVKHSILNTGQVKLYNEIQKLNNRSRLQFHGRFPIGPSTRNDVKGKKQWVMMLQKRHYPRA